MLRFPEEAFFPEAVLPPERLPFPEEAFFPEEVFLPEAVLLPEETLLPEEVFLPEPFFSSPADFCAMVRASFRICSGCSLLRCRGGRTVSAGSVEEQFESFTA